MGNEVKSGCFLIIEMFGRFFTLCGTAYVLFFLFNPESLFEKIMFGFFQFLKILQLNLYLQGL